MKQHVYVVEMKGRKNWTAIEAELKRSDACTLMSAWMASNPDDVFRVKKYAPHNAIGE